METSMDGLKFIITPSETNPNSVRLVDTRKLAPTWKTNPEAVKKVESEGYSVSYDTPYLILASTYIKRLPPPNESYYYSQATKAKKGYGPLLYDKVIEIVSGLGCKLVNHAGQMRLLHNDTSGGFSSPSATAVWNKYKDRQDVKKHPIDDKFYALSKDPDQKYFYEK